MFKKLLLISSLLMASCASDYSEPTGTVSSELDVRADGKGAVVRNFNENTAKGGGHGPGGGSKGSGIFYHGGPVMLGTVKVYTVWYGNWAGNTATTILPDFITNLSGSPYFNINTTYYDGNSNTVSGNLVLAGSTTDSYSLGTNLTDLGVQMVVENAISNGSLPQDQNGIYLVLTSADVNETSGFCTSYCGWHYFTASGLKYSFVGNPDRCPSACSTQSVSPNGNAGADGMASIIAHEIEEAVTDPLLNAWYDRRGYENADKCAWKFGTTYTAANGSQANVHLGSRDYLIQQNWVNAGSGGCAMHL